MRVLRNAGAFCMKTMNRICVVIDDLKLAVFVIKSITAFDVTFGCTFFVSELAVVSATLGTSKHAHARNVHGNRGTEERLQSDALASL